MTFYLIDQFLKDQNMTKLRGQNRTLLHALVLLNYIPVKELSFFQKMQ
jgi:hypothetical protein